MKFEEAVGYIFILEGGETDDPRDRGGRTKFGIAKAFFPDINFDAFTKADARVIYKTQYWNAMRIESLPPALRLPIFDAGVNIGPGTAIRLLQRVLGVSEDGIVGEITLKALENRPHWDVIDAFQHERLLHYVSLADFNTFGRGWVNRIAQVTKWAQAADV